MSDDRSSFENTRARLEDIVVQARRKDVSLEQSLDLLEEAVRLVNQCNELIDQTSFRAPVPDADAPDAEPGASPVTVTEAIDAVVVSEDWGAEDAWAGDAGSPAAEEDDERE